nr:reverse transcriptase domain-containing protein [Tanacetum cinerariifolium]
GLRRVVPKNYNPKGERFLIASRFPPPPLACSFFSLRATVTSSSKLSRDQTSNPTSSTNPTAKGQIPRSSKQKVENSNFEEHLPPVATMTDNRTMAEMLHAPTKRCAEAIVVPSILTEQFKLKHSLINMMTSEKFFGLKKDNPHDHIRWFNKITSIIKYKDVPNSVIKLILFHFSLVEAARRWLEKEPPRSITTWDDLVSKFINEFFPPSRTTNLRNEISNFQQKFDESFHEAWERYKDLLRACPHHGFTELYQLDTFYNALNPADQDSLNAATGGNLLEKSPQDTLTIIENKSKLQANPPPAQVKAVEEICVTCGGAHPYYQCLATGGNTFPEFRDNIQGYVSAVAGNYNQGNPDYRPQGVANQMRPPEQPYQATAQSNQNIHLNELEKIKRMNDVSMKAMQNHIDMVKNELRNEMKTSIQTSLPNQTNKIKNMMASLLQMNTASTLGSGSLLGNTVANPKGELKAITTHSGLVTDGPTVTTPPKSITLEEDECVEETYTDPDLAEYTIKVPPLPVQKHKPLKMLKALLSNKEKLQELANTPLNENCSAVILKKLPQKLRDPGKFLIPCGFRASINLMPLSVWRKLGLPDLIPTRMTLELANHAICTPDGIARDVFSPLILGRPFLRTARALIDVHGEEMILRDGDERLTLNMTHNTTSYSNHPHRESVNLINIFNVSSEYFLEDLFLHQQSGNPTFSLHKEITSPKVTHEIHDSEGCNFLSEELPDIDSFNDIHPHFDDNPVSGSTTYSSNSLLEEFTDELTLITYPPDYDDNLKFDIESDLREIEFLLYHGEDSDLKDSIDQIDLANFDDYFVDSTPEMFNDEHAPDYSFPPRFDVYPDDFLEVESDADNFYNDPFDSKGEKIKESKLLIDELDLPCDFLPYLEYDSINSQDFSRDDDLPSPDNEDKVFNPGILIQEKSVTIITRVAQEKKLAISYASLVFEDFDTPFFEPLVFKDVPNSMRLLPFASKNEEKVFKPGIYTSENVHSCFLPELSHPGHHVFKVNQIFISLIKIFHAQCGKNNPLLDVLLFYFYPP